MFALQLEFELYSKSYLPFQHHDQQHPTQQHTDQQHTNQHESVEMGMHEMTDHHHHHVSNTHIPHTLMTDVNNTSVNANVNDPTPSNPSVMETAAVPVQTTNPEEMQTNPDYNPAHIAQQTTPENDNTTETAANTSTAAAIQHTPPTWHDFFSQLQSHKTTYGTLDVDPQTNPPLYTWVEEQRQLYKLYNQMHGHQHQQVQLQQEEGANEQEQSHNPEQQETGENHISPTPTITIPHDTNITFNDINTAITQDRIFLLTQLGFDFTTPKDPNYTLQTLAQSTFNIHPHPNNNNPNNHNQLTTNISTFHVRISQLQQYKSIHGHPNVPETYKSDIELGRWVSQQRALYRKQTLSKEKMDVLIQLGFDFSPGDKKVLFDQRIQQLKEYQLKYGTVDVPRRYEDNPR